MKKTLLKQKCPSIFSTACHNIFRVHFPAIDGMPSHSSGGQVYFLKPVPFYEMSYNMFDTIKGRGNFIVYMI